MESYLHRRLNTNESSGLVSGNFSNALGGISNNSGLIIRYEMPVLEQFLLDLRGLKKDRKVKNVAVSLETLRRDEVPQFVYLRT